MRKAGWAFNDREDSGDAYCISAPIFNKVQKVVAAISASGVFFQVAPERMPELAKMVQSTAQEISHKINY